MKKIAGLVLFLVILILVGYYGMGIVTEHTVKNNVISLNKSSGIYGDLIEYKRGWFVSKALFNWRLHIPARTIKSADGQSQTFAAQDYQVQMPVTVQHGPIIFLHHDIKFGLGYAHTMVSLPDDIIKQFDDLFVNKSVKPQLDLNLFINYFNNCLVQINVPKFNLIAKQGNMQVNWLGMTSAINVTSTMNDLVGSISVDGVDFLKDQLNVIVGKILCQYNLHKNKYDLYLGDFNVIMPSLTIKNAQDPMFSIADFTFDSHSSVNDELFNSNIKTFVKQLNTTSRVIGPVNLKIAIKNLDTAILVQINEQINQMQQSTNDIAKQQALLTILPKIPGLLGRGAELEISEMSIVVADTVVDGNLLISLPKTDKIGIFELIQKIHGTGSLKLPELVLQDILKQSIKQKLLLQQNKEIPEPSNVSVDVQSHDMLQQIKDMTSQQITNMLQSGLLVKHDNYYVIDCKLQDGHLSINNKDFNAAMLKF